MAVIAYLILFSAGALIISGVLYYLFWTVCKIEARKRGRKIRRIKENV
jgi:uncharacterized membrane protein YciS (DUF1049 family)